MTSDDFYGDSLTTAEVDNLYRALEAELTRREAAKLWKPFPGKPQDLAVSSLADELFFGGAAGAGKTQLVLGLAVTAHQRSLILRRLAVELPEVTSSLKQIVGSRGTWVSDGKGGTMTVDGERTVEVSGCEYEDSKTKYQGRAHDLKAFDEITSFTRSQYQFIIGWNRTSDPHQRCRVIATGNPPVTPEGRWVVEEWGPWLEEKYHDPARPGELRWYWYDDEGKLEWVSRDARKTVRNPDGTTRVVGPRSRTFLPGRVTDNPVLMQNDDYLSRLYAMPEPLRSKLLYGDFSAGTEDDQYQVIPTAWVRAAQARWTPDGGKDQPLSCVGCDPARGGADKTVLAPRRGPWFARLTKRPGKSTPDGTAVVDLIVQAVVERVDIPVHIDVIGIGAAVYDLFRQVRHARPVGVSFGSGTNRRDRSGRLTFANLRAWAYWYMREALDPVHGDNLALPPDPELLADLCAPRWEQRASGVIVEPKDGIAKRIGRSPDCGDACVLALMPIAGWECASSVPNPASQGGHDPSTGRALSGGDRLRALLERSRERYSGGRPANLDPFRGRRPGGMG